MMQEPQNKVFRRPRRSRVKTATNVENFELSALAKRSDVPERNYHIGDIVDTGDPASLLT